MGGSNSRDVQQSPEESGPELAKRPKTFHQSQGGALNQALDGEFTLRHDDYTVAWVCALYIEMAAAKAMLDNIHETPPMDMSDGNTYVLGNIGRHNIVIACLPDGRYGTNNAASIVTNISRTFTSIRFQLVVGIGGGAPGNDFDLRLGDVVVGTRVMQYDLGKIVDEGQLKRTAIPRFPHQHLGTAVSALRAKHELEPSRVLSILQEKLGRHQGYCHPGAPDRLFRADYCHRFSNASCDECDQSKLVARSRRTSDDCMIHYGAIGSSNQVMRDGKARDTAARELDVICFEMEAAGVMEVLPCLPIRGICDYADSHKSKEWQRYAAAAAAAYARELIEILPVAHVPEQRQSSNIPGISALNKLKKIQYLAYMERTDSPPQRGNRQIFMAALNFDQIDARRANIETAHARTCEWFITHPSYREWLDREMMARHHGFLWLSGKPGAGKSTIMKFAYTSMKQKLRGSQSLVISFFFNARGEKLERSVTGMYRSLLLQLLRSCPHLQAVLDDSGLLSDYGDFCPPLNILKDQFRNAVAALGDRALFCFIDALDECDEQQVLDMVHYYEELAEHAMDKVVSLRICFSSRHYPYIIIRRGVRLTLEDQDGHSQDLQKYVASRLRTEDAALREELLAKSGGVFLWVVLVVDILNKELSRGGLALKKRLAELPSGLSELFKDLLRRDDESMEALLICVLWVLCAKAPLEPSVFHHALWSGLSLRGLVDPGFLSTLSPPDASESIERSVTSYSKGLIEITRTRRPIVQFIHESVRDFLIKDKGLQMIWAEAALDWESQANEELAKICIYYLENALVENTPLSNFLLKREYVGNSMIPNKYPFLGYASGQVLYHADAVRRAESQNQILSRFSAADWAKICNLYEKHAVRRYSPQASLFYILADQGYAELIRTKLKDDANIHVRGERYEYPLFAALANNNKKAVAAILNTPTVIYNGEDITGALGYRNEMVDYEYRTPLTWCAQFGRTGMAELLLKSGVDVDEIDSHGATALFRAVQSSHVAMVRLLCDFGGRVNATVLRRTPLYWAAGVPSVADADQRKHAIIKTLLDRGAAVNAVDGSGKTALYSAMGCAATMNILLVHAAEVNITDQLGRAPLSYAVEYLHGEEAVQLLLDHGAHVNALDRVGWTPLFYATQSCNMEAMQLLLRAGADINITNKQGQTLLDYARNNCNRRVVQLLLHGEEAECEWTLWTPRNS